MFFFLPLFEMIFNKNRVGGNNTLRRLGGEFPRGEQEGSSKAGGNTEHIRRGRNLLRVLSFLILFLRRTLCTAALDNFFHFLDKRRAVSALEGVFPTFAAEGGAAGALSFCSPRAAASTL